MELAKVTWSEVETYLTGRTIIIVPAGSTEQHGPNGILGTDALVAQHLAVAVSEQTGALTAPCISYGMSTYHLGFPGTISLKPSTMQLVVIDVVESLLRHGFQKFFFINGHGGNMPNLQLALTQIALSAKVEFTIQSWWQDAKIGKLTESLFKGREGAHATPAEISMTKYFFPGLLKEIPSTWTESDQSPRWSSNPGEFRRLFPDGAIGSDQSLANERDGKTIFDTVVHRLASKLRQFEKNGIVAPDKDD